MVEGILEVHSRPHCAASLLCWLSKVLARPPVLSQRRSSKVLRIFLPGSPETRQHRSRPECVALQCEAKGRNRPYHSQNALLKQLRVAEIGQTGHLESRRWQFPCCVSKARWWWLFVIKFACDSVWVSTFAFKYLR